MLVCLQMLLGTARAQLPIPVLQGTSLRNQQPHRQRQCGDVSAAASGSDKLSTKDTPPTVAPVRDQIDPGDPAKRNLLTAAGATRRLGWASFWTQITLNVVSCILFVFSVAFAPTVRVSPSCICCSIDCCPSGDDHIFSVGIHVSLARFLASFISQQTLPYHSRSVFWAGSKLTSRSQIW